MQRTRLIGNDRLQGVTLHTRHLGGRFVVAVPFRCERCPGLFRSMSMRSVISLLVIRAAELLDRSLITVPEIDEILFVPGFLQQSAG